jgi:hypothetical protein
MKMVKETTETSRGSGRMALATSDKVASNEPSPSLSQSGGRAEEKQEAEEKQDNVRRKMEAEGEGEVIPCERPEDIIERR